MFLIKDIRSISKKFNFYLEPIKKIINNYDNDNSNNNPLIVKKEEINLSELIIITPFIIKEIEFIIFNLNFISESYKIIDYKYEWTISNFKDDFKYLNSRKESNLKISRNDLLSGFNDIILEIFDPKLNKTFRKFFRYLKPIPPYGGNCIVNPPKGIFGKNNFEFIFSGWKSESAPLIYRVKYLDKKNNFIDISLGGLTGIDEIRWISKIIPISDKFILEVSDNSGYQTTISCPLVVNVNKDTLILENFLTNDIFDPFQKQLILEVFKSNLVASTKTSSNYNTNTDPYINTNTNNNQKSNSYPNPNSNSNPNPKSNSNPNSKSNSNPSPNSNSNNKPKSSSNPYPSTNSNTDNNSNANSSTNNTNSNENSNDNSNNNSNENTDKNLEIIKLNDMIIRNIYNLLTSIGNKSSNELLDFSSSLLSILSQPFSNSEIKNIFESIKIIAEKVEPYSENKNLIGIIIELIDELKKKIEKTQIDNIDSLSKYDLINQLNSLNELIINYISMKLINGQSFEVKSPSTDIKLTKVSNLNITPILMNYDIEEKLFKKSKRKIKVRFLQNQNNEENCNSENSVICLDNEKVNKMMKLSQQGNIEFKGQLNKDENLQIQQEQFSNSFNFHFSSIIENNNNNNDKNQRILLFNNKNEKENETEKILFEVRLKFPKDKEIEELGPATCIQYENIKITDVSCLSFYDLNTREIICLCEKPGLTVNVMDKNLASLSKMKQFPPLSPNICNNYYNYNC